jgi:hypothetical protein
MMEQIKMGTTDQARKRRHRPGAGFTIPAFADHFGLPVSQVRSAVKRGEIQTVTWAGLERIPPSEADRVGKLFGLTPPQDAE